MENPTVEEVDALHSLYMEALTTLYNTHNPQYGDTAVSLVIT